MKLQSYVMKLRVFVVKLPHRCETNRLVMKLHIVAMKLHIIGMELHTIIKNTTGVHQMAVRVSNQYFKGRPSLVAVLGTF